jgi:hypothetical protein
VARGSASLAMTEEDVPCHGERSRIITQKRKPMPITFQPADIKLPPLKKAALKKFLSTQIKKKLRIGMFFAVMIFCWI